MPITRRPPGGPHGRRVAAEPLLSARELLAEARVHERAGRIDEAFAAFEAVIAASERSGESQILAESLRRLSVLCHHRNEPDRARALCRRSQETAELLGDDGLAAEALNTLGSFEFEHGAMLPARELLGQALARAGGRADLQSRIEQNLGIIATIQGDHEAALRRKRQRIPWVRLTKAR